MASRLGEVSPRAGAAGNARVFRASSGVPVGALSGL